MENFILSIFLFFYFFSIFKTHPGLLFLTL